MLETVDPETSPAAPLKSDQLHWLSPVAALLSALVPGLGQQIAGERGKATLLFALDAVWILLFFPPLRLPAFYHGWLAVVLGGLALCFVSSLEALRSTSDKKRAGSYLWLLATLPFAVITPMASHALLLRISGFRDFRITSGSMAPAVQTGDVIMADLHRFRHSRPRDGEIILLRSPNTPGVIVIKRVIASGGETLEGRDGRIVRNGVTLDEPYVQHTGSAPDEIVNFGPLTVPRDKIFVMGDDRDISLDSRMPEFGPVDASTVVGKALYLIRANHSRDGAPLD